MCWLRFTLLSSTQILNSSCSLQKNALGHESGLALGHALSQNNTLVDLLYYLDDWLMTWCRSFLPVDIPALSLYFLWCFLAWSPIFWVAMARLRFSMGCARIAPCVVSSTLHNVDVHVHVDVLVKFLYSLPTCVLPPSLCYFILDLIVNGPSIQLTFTWVISHLLLCFDQCVL